MLPFFIGYRNLSDFFAFRYAFYALPSAPCPMRHALCPMRHALCPMPLALCPMPYAPCPMRVMNRAALAAPSRSIGTPSTTLFC